MKAIVNTDNVGIYYGTDISIKNGLFVVDEAALGGADVNAHTIVNSAPEKFLYPDVWKLVDGSWVVNNQSIYDDCETAGKAVNNARMKELRAVAYKDTDPLFFKAQRGEITTQEWLDAVQAVKDKYPYI